MLKIDWAQNTMLCNCKDTLTKISFDKEHQESMITSKTRVVDFDKVKTNYLNSMKLSEENLHSADAFVSGNDTQALVEFKNGDMQNEKAGVKLKIRDSLLVFGGITDDDIKVTSEHLEFILVYNEDKNKLSKEEVKSIQESPSRTKIAGYLSKKGKKEFIRFGLELFERVYFKKVHTYTVDEFTDWMNHAGIKL